MYIFIPVFDTYNVNNVKLVYHKGFNEIHPLLYIKDKPIILFNSSSLFKNNMSWTSVNLNDDPWKPTLD